MGPDWKPEFTEVGTIVPNHASYMDIVMAYGYFFPAFVAKRSVANIIGIHTISKAIDCLYVDRAGTKEEKIKLA